MESAAGPEKETVGKENKGEITVVWETEGRTVERGLGVEFIAEKKYISEIVQYRIFYNNSMTGAPFSRWPF